MKAPKDHFIIQIDITNACGHKCSNCTRFCGQLKKPYFMDFDYFCKAVDTLTDHPGLIGVMGGEPTLHPQFEEMCKYLQKTVGRIQKVHADNFKYPTDHLVEERLRDQLKRYEIEEYSDGPRAVIKGTGLWTSVTAAYLKHYETIQDTFNWQNLNDHTSASFHQPILISRAEMGIGDDQWIKLREKCWVNQEWSGSVTPKGCFFCEVAGAFDMIYDGPGGLPLEEGWWKRDISDYKEQFRWCEMCGIPLKTFSRDAREETDDVSEYHYGKLKDSPNILLGRKNINVLKIENHLISKKSVNEREKYRGQTYIDDAHDRVSAESPVYAKELYGVLLGQGESGIEEIKMSIQKNRKFFKELVLLTNREYPDIGADCILYDEKNAFEKLREAIEYFGKGKYIVLFSPQIMFSEKINILKQCVINPGTLHYFDFYKAGGKKENDFVLNSGSLTCGICLLVNGNALSYRTMDSVEGTLYQCIRAMGKQWDQKKIVHFSNSMNRNIYQMANRNMHKERIADMFMLVKRLTGRYGFGRILRYGMSTLKHYGLKLTLDKVKGRVY